MRGIASIYGYCKRRKIPFYLYHTYPFKMENYLCPNCYDWIIKEEQISYNPEEAYPVILQLKSLPSKLHRLYLDRIVSKYPNRQIHIYTNTLFDDKMYAVNFGELFKPVERLQAEVNRHIERIGTDYVAMVFRFQQLLGDFKEDGFPTLDLPERERLIEKCIEEVERIRSERHQDCKVLVTSDSTGFLERIKAKKEYVEIIPGRVVHVDFSEDCTYDVYLKSFVDMFVLSKAMKVYMLYTEQMYRSGFGKRAAAITGIPYEEIHF